jgi:hypothetical protein
MQSISIKFYSQFFIALLAICNTGCNEKYSSLNENTNSSDSSSSSRKSTTSQSSSMKWSTSSLSSNGLQVYISDELIAEFDSQDYEDDKNPVQQMLQRWNESVESTVLFDVSSSSDANSISVAQKTDLADYNDNVLGIYKHDEWFSDVSSSALAITQFFGKRINSGTEYEYLELIHADIIINFKEFSFGIGDKSIEDYDLPSVVLHELGHFLGLGHSSYNDTSVMVPYLDVGVEKRELYEYDIESINDLYLSQTSDSSFITSALSLGTQTTKPKSEDNQDLVQGIIELQANGDCKHYIDGALVKVHKKMPEL